MDPKQTCREVVKKTFKNTKNQKEDGLGHFA